MSDLAQLTDSLMKNYVGFTGGNLILLWDEPTEHIAASIVASAISLDASHGAFITPINIDEYRNGNPLLDLPSELKQRMEEQLQSKDSSQNTVLYIMHSLPGEVAMRKQLNALAQQHGKIGGLPGCTDKVLAAAFNPKNNPSFSAELFDFIGKENAIRVTDDSGTDVIVDIDNARYAPIHSSGILRPGKYGNPIPAEVYLFPADVNGKVVIKGTYGALMEHERFKENYGSLVAALQKSPIVWQLKSGVITDVLCTDSDIQRYVCQAIFERDPANGRKIGEFGLPANLYVLSSVLTGNLLIDEKGRVHFANGDGYQHNGTRCPYVSSEHSDGLIANATLFSHRLGQLIMVNNSYNPEVFKMLSR